MTKRLLARISLIACLASVAPVAHSAPSAEELAKMAQNPVGNLISHGGNCARKSSSCFPNDDGLTAAAGTDP